MPPQSDSRNKVYGGDGYTPTAPSVEYPVNYDALRKFEKTISDLSKKVGGGVFSNDSALRRIGVEDVTDMSLNEIANKLSSDDSVRDFINKVKSMFKGNKAAMDEAAFNEFGTTVAEFKKAEKLWKDTLKVAQEKANEAKQGKVETTEVADNTNGVSFSLKSINGKQIFWVENNQLTNKELKSPYAVAKYIEAHIGEVYTIIVSGQKLHIGKDFPKEYTRSKYTSYFKKK